MGKFLLSHISLVYEPIKVLFAFCFIIFGTVCLLFSIPIPAVYTVTESIV